MCAIRRRLSWLVAGWLMCQCAGVLAAPVTLGCHTTKDACCTNLKPGQTCPMHHQREGDRTCKMRSACSPADLALLTLTTALAVVPQPTDVVIAFNPGESVSPDTRAFIARTPRPESPPPKTQTL